MADIYEQNLGSKANLTTSDYIRLVGSDNASYKQPITQFPKVLDSSVSNVGGVTSNDLVRIQTASGNPAFVKVSDFMSTVDISSTWMGIQNRVESGTAELAYPVGTQIADTWAESTSASYTTQWDVVNYDTNGNMYLKWHYAYPTGVPFDQPEALYYAAGTETAGTYHIGIGTAYGTGWVTSKSIQITTTATMAAGDQLVLDITTDNSVDPTAGITWRIYGAGSTTVKQSGTTSNGTSGTSLGSTSSTGIGYTNGRVNSPQRVVYGYNRWSQSAVRQWLNSSAAAGSWWSLQNPWDRPPTVATTLRGFLAGFSDGFLSVLQATDVVTALNTIEGQTATTETTSDKIFLPSLQEMYVTPQLANVEGVDWTYYQQLAANAGLTGRFAQGGTYPVLITYNLANTTSPVTVWLRSADRGGADSAWGVTSAGGVTNYYRARYAGRGCPACIIKKSS